MYLKDEITSLLEQHGFDYDVKDGVISGEYGQSIDDSTTVVCRFSINADSKNATLNAVLYRNGHTVTINEDDPHFVEVLRFMLHENYTNELTYWGRCDSDCDKPGAVFFTMDLASLPKNPKAFFIMLYAFMEFATDAMKRLVSLKLQGGNDGN